MAIPKVVADLMRARLVYIGAEIDTLTQMVDHLKRTLAHHIGEREGLMMAASDIRQFLEAHGEPVEAKGAEDARESHREAS